MSKINDKMGLGLLKHSLPGSNCDWGGKFCLHLCRNGPNLSKILEFHVNFLHKLGDYTLFIARETETVAQQVILLKWFTGDDRFLSAVM